MQGHLAHNWEGLESAAFSWALVLGPWEGELGPYRNWNGRIPCVGSHREQGSRLGSCRLSVAP